MADKRPYTYSWSDGFSGDWNRNLMTGAYSVTVTDANGCQGFGSVHLDEPMPMSIHASIIDEERPGSQDGIITLSAGNGNDHYIYLWDGGFTESVRTQLSAGSYNVTATNTSGCTLAETFTVENVHPCMLEAQLGVHQHIECKGDMNGILVPYAWGGVEPYTYAWSHGETSDTTGLLVAGYYDVTITDVGGCTTSTGIYLSEPSEITAILHTSNESNIGQNDGTATADGYGGTPPYSYHWSTGAATQTITNLSGGTYTVTVNRQQ